MTKASSSETLAFAVLIGTIAYCWLGLVPPAESLHQYLFNPASFALVAATVSASVYVAISVTVAPPLPWQRLLLALFLAGMPFIYLWAAIVAGDRDAIILETLGVFVFVPMAAWGYRRSLLILGIGIAAHGIAWDAWHHHNAAYIEPWYPFGCLVVDVAFFIVAAAQSFGREGTGAIPVFKVSDPK